MTDLDDIKTDAAIASILKKLKATGKNKKSVDNTLQVKDQTQEDHELEVIASDVIVNNTSDEFNNTQTKNKYILPWFSESNLDNEFIHYVKMSTSGRLDYDKVRHDASPSELAALKLQKNYLCDIDYYKSEHYVLCVKQIDSDYNLSRSDVAQSGVSDIEVEETKFIDNENIITESIANCETNIEKESTENAVSEVLIMPEYTHFVVFTDLGIVDFIALKNDVEYPYTADNLSLWFEEVSNYTQIKQPRFNANTDICKNIKDFKYDLITMHIPGIISLDSSDNDDSNYSLTLKVKDEFSFIPLSRLLGCLKYYSTSSIKSIDDFRHFVCKYFDIIK